MTQWYRNCFHHVTPLWARRLNGMSARSNNAKNQGPLPPSRYPGERLGLPETGIQSVGRVGRRIAAIAIDWSSAIAVTMLLAGMGYGALSSSNTGQLATLGIFVVLQIAGIWAMGGSIGHRLLGLYLVSVDGQKPAWWRPVVRSILLALVIPALVWDSDQRGFHDKIAGTILIRSS
jgi:uncharacterized RDD family membrane protein YckC